MGVAQLKYEKQSTGEYSGFRRELTQSQYAELEFLRQVYLDCRAKPSSDLFSACDLLAFESDLAKASYAEALIRSLPQILDKKPVVMRPGYDFVSFDEAWLMSLIQACQEEDDDSMAFLVVSRVDPVNRRNAVFLASNLSRNMNFS